MDVSTCRSSPCTLRSAGLESLCHDPRHPGSLTLKGWLVLAPVIVRFKTPEKSKLDETLAELSATPPMTVQCPCSKPAPRQAGLAVLPRSLEIIFRLRIMAIGHAGFVGGVAKERPLYTSWGSMPVSLPECELHARPTLRALLLSTA